MNDMTASRQWRERPVDERFWTLKDMHAACIARHEASVESKVRLHELVFDTDAVSRELAVVGQGNLAHPSHLAFSQLTELVGLNRSEWLRAAPANLVADTLNWAVRRPEAPRESMVMMWQKGDDGGPGLARCFNTTTYGRLWDADIVAWLREMTADETNGWSRPPAYTDNKYPSGYYSGDRDLFVFMVNPARHLEAGPDSDINRGFFCWNTEVKGGKLQSFGFRAFAYDRVCGNHIVWGAEELFKLWMPHVGQGMSRRAQVETQRVLGAYLESSAKQEEQAIADAQEYVIGGSQDEASTWLRARGFTKTDAEAAWNDAVQRDANLTTLWGAVGSLTRLSQQKKWADDRNEMDRRAGKLMTVVF